MAPSSSRRGHRTRSAIDQRRPSNVVPGKSWRTSNGNTHSCFQDHSCLKASGFPEDVRMHLNSQKSQNVRLVPGARQHNGKNLGSGIGSAFELLYLFTGWCGHNEKVLKIPLDKFRDFGYVKLREFKHGVAEDLPSSWPHRKIKAEDRLSSAAVA